MCQVRLGGRKVFACVVLDGKKGPRGSISDNNASVFARRVREAACHSNSRNNAP